MRSRLCFVFVAALAVGIAGNLQAQSPEVVSEKVKMLVADAAKTKDPALKKQMLQQIRALQRQQLELADKGPAVRSGYAGSDETLPDGPPPARNGRPVTAKSSSNGPPTDWSAGSYRGYRTGPAGGAVFGGNYGWGNTTPSPNPLISHRGSYPVYNVPYIGKNGTVAFGGMQFGRNGFSGPFFQTNKYGGNFFGFPIRFR